MAANREDELQVVQRPTLQLSNSRVGMKETPAITPGLAKHGGGKAWDSTGGGRNAFITMSQSFLKDEEEHQLVLAALEHQNTMVRARTAVVKNYDATKEAVTKDGQTGKYTTVDVLDIAQDKEQRRLLAEGVVSHLDFNFRRRLDRVGLELPTAEVRYKDLSVEAEVFVGGRALPTLTNTVRNTVDSFLAKVGLHTATKQPFPILKNVNGVIKPGRMTLLLGPPGSGKSTLLLALAGRLPPGLKQTGSITYNGRGLNEFVPKKTASYISQVDNHLGELTVRETLDFSARVLGVGAKEHLLKELVRKEKEMRIMPDPHIDAFVKAAALTGQQHHVMTDYVLKVLGLDVCADTVVGNEMLRGISGGQKKRVTLAEYLVGPMTVHFMDEISTGLDSSTTLQIVENLRTYTHQMGATVFVSLLQPAPEVFELFDDVVLLSDGHVVYSGPRESVLPFFEECGFKIPARKGAADFLQEVTSKKDQGQYWHRRNEAYRYVPVQEFAKRFADFEAGKALHAELDTPFDNSKAHSLALAKDKFAVTSTEAIKALWDRHMLLVKRNAFIWIFRLFVCVVLAIITSTTFARNRMKIDDIQDANYYLGALFFSLLFMLFSGLTHTDLTVKALPVFYKQRDSLFFPAWTWAFPTTLFEVPYSILESVVWACITYWIIGWTAEAGRFFTFILILIGTQNMSTSLFRMNATILRTIVAANTGGGFMFLVLLVLGGFIVTKNDIPSWWIWGYWISPLAYAQNAVAINEFSTSRWDAPYSSVVGNCYDSCNLTVGEALLTARDIPTNYGWVWIGIPALYGFGLLFNVIMIAALYLPSPDNGTPAVPEEQVEERKRGSVHDPRAAPPAGTTLVAIEETSGAAAAGTPRLGGPQKSVKGMAASRSRVGQQASGLGMQKSGLSAVDYATSFVDEETGVEKRGMVLPFLPLNLTFSKVNYYVPLPKEAAAAPGVTDGRLRLLNDVSGAFRPGVLTALMGESGAGKTTLMDVLAGRKTSGTVEGDIRISGFPKEQSSFARVSGYVEQFDIHSPRSTVREALAYSAWLRLPKEVDKATRERFVDEVLELVELTSLRGSLVGLPGISGLSVEQRKRLTIAVELVANPSIIFMDEPTSGLDARAAAIVMRTVKNIVETGRTIVCTIHQPSIDIFEAFDELVLMKRGGQLIYCGPLGHQSKHLVSYFEAIPGSPPIKEGYNPAAWMLEITSPAQVEKTGTDFAQLYLESEVAKKQQEIIAECSQPEPGTEPLHFDTERATDPGTQYIALCWKTFKSYWRYPEYNVTRFIFTIVDALLIGSIAWGIGKKQDDQFAILGIMGVVYAVVQFVGISNANNIQPVIAIERIVSYRERAAGMYSAMPWILSIFTAELPYLVLQTLVYCLITFSMLQFTWTWANFWYWNLFTFLTLTLYAGYGTMAIALTPGVEIAQILSVFFYFTWNLFSGFIISQPGLQDKAPWWLFFYYLNPLTWALYGSVASQLGNVDTPIVLQDGTNTTVSGWLDRDFNYQYDFLGQVVAIMLGFTAFCVFVAIWAFRKFNFQSR